MQPTDKFSGHRGHLYDRDHAANTHLEPYNAYEALGGSSGFSGQGYAVIETATGLVLGRHAWRLDALGQQARIEALQAEMEAAPNSVEQMQEIALREDAACPAHQQLAAHTEHQWDPRDAAEVYVGLGDYDGGC